MKFPPYYIFLGVLTIEMDKTCNMSSDEGCRNVH